MKIKTGYLLSMEVNEMDVIFENESDRNEVALALFEEELYEHFMYEYNNCGFFEEEYIEIYGSIEGVWRWRMEVIKGHLHEIMWSYEVIMVEG